MRNEQSTIRKHASTVWIITLAVLAAAMLGLAMRALAVVPTTSDLVPYACNGSATQFVFNFGVFATDEVRVVLVGSDDVETPLTENSDYTVTLPNGDGFLLPGGTVTTTTAYASGNTIVISRLPDLRQESGYSTAGSLDLETIEDDFDRAVVRDQYLARQIARALRAPGTDATDFNLPVASQRASSMIGFDANGAPYMVAGLLGPNEVNVSNYWHATLDDANWPDSVASLGFGGTLRDLLLLSAPNDYTVQQTIGGVRELDVRWFGATGDGVTDDTNAIQLAIDTAEALGHSRVVLPAGTYLTTSPLTISGTQHIQLGGPGVIDFNEAGYAVVLQSDYCVLEDLTIRCGLTASGGLHVDGNDNQAQSNVIRNLRIMSRLAADKSEPNRRGIYVQATAPYAAYFNTFAYNRIKGFYDGIVLAGEANVNFFSANLIEYYYRYGLDANDCDENIMTGGFFHQAPGRDAGDLTYAVRVGAGGTYNIFLYGAEPGGFSAAAWIDNGANLFLYNPNCPYGSGGSAASAVQGFGPHGGLGLRRGRLVIADDDAYPPLRITERSVAPTGGAANDVYIDAGKNTKSTFPAFRRHTGSAWEDVGRSGLVHAALTIDVNQADPNGSDDQFDNTQGNTSEQVITWTNALPAYAELVSVQLRCTETVTGSATMSIDVGTASGGNQILAAANTDSANDLNPTPAGDSPELAATNAARSVYINATPGVNWSTLSQGRWVLILTYLDYAALYTQKASE